MINMQEDEKMKMIKKCRISPSLSLFFFFFFSSPYDSSELN